MKLFGSITIEEVIVNFVVGVAGTIFVIMCARLWRRSLHFVGTTRKQRRREHYIEVRRRTKDIEYLSFKEAQVHVLIHLLVFLCFLLLIMLLLTTSGPFTDPIAVPGLALMMLVAGGSVGFIALTEAPRNQAARAFRAGLIRDRRTRQFVWPPSRNVFAPKSRGGDCS